MTYKYQTIIDLLTEARRYPKTSQRHAREILDQAVEEIHLISPWTGTIARVVGNLEVASRDLALDPDIFVCYCTGAIHEFQWLGTISTETPSLPSGDIQESIT